MDLIAGLFTKGVHFPKGLGMPGRLHPSPGSAPVSFAGVNLTAFLTNTLSG